MPAFPKSREMGPSAYQATPHPRCTVPRQTDLRDVRVRGGPVDVVVVVVPGDAHHNEHRRAILHEDWGDEDVHSAISLEGVVAGGVVTDLGEDQAAAAPVWKWARATGASLAPDTVVVVGLVVQSGHDPPLHQRHL